MDVTSFSTSYGPWAIVTGASSGMGREFARQLAGAGVNLVIAARRIDRLEALADELRSTNDVAVRVVQADLGTVEGVDAIDKAAADIDIGLLISNAGGASPGSFLKTSAEDQATFLHLNATAPMRLTHIFGQRMVERGSGGIVLVASTGGFGAAPYIANYSAAKSYQIVLGESLNTEFGESGVDVLVVAPGPTRTEMAEMDGTDFSSMPMKWMEPEDVAEAALGALGRKPLLVPGRVNRTMKFMMTRVLSRRASTRMWGSMMAKATDDALL